MNRIIAITGGIGSGKSVVARVLGCMGYEIYDCDSQARQIMEESEDIKLAIGAEVCREAITASGIDRRILAQKVFSDTQALEALNRIVHRHVRDHFKEWSSSRTICFVDTAILHSSGMDTLVDEIWEVTAPKEIRIERVIARNNLSIPEIEKRMEAQKAEEATIPALKKRVINNDGAQAILPQIEALLNLSDCRK